MDRAILLYLLVAWAVLLMGGFLFGRLNQEKTQRMPVWTRLLSSFILVIAAWLWFASVRHGMMRNYAAGIAFGMSLGFLGDIFMSGILNTPRWLLWGMSAFGLGHLFYISAFWGVYSKFGSGLGTTELAVVAGWLLAGIAGWYAVVLRGSEQVRMLRFAALPYALLLAIAAAAATLLTLQAPVFVFAAIGATLFLLSDLILSLRLFRKMQFFLINDVVWLLYGPAQALIVYSIWNVM